MAVVKTSFVKSAHRQHVSKEQIGKVLIDTMTSLTLEGQEKYEGDRVRNSIARLSPQERKECEVFNENESNKGSSERNDVDDDIDMESLRMDTKSPSKIEPTRSTIFGVLNYRFDIKEIGFDSNKTQINYIRKLWEDMLLEQLNQIVEHYETLPQILPSATLSYVNPLETNSDIISNELLRYIADAFRWNRLCVSMLRVVLQPYTGLPPDLYKPFFTELDLITSHPSYKWLSLTIIRPEKDDFYNALASQLFNSNQVSHYQIRELRFDDFQMLAENLDDERKQKINTVLQQKRLELSVFRDLYLNFRHIWDKYRASMKIYGRKGLDFILDYYVSDDEQYRIEENNRRFEKLRNVVQSLKETADPDTLAELGLFLFNCAQLKSASEHLPYEREGRMEGKEFEIELL